MDVFIAQLSQLLMSADEEGWLAGLCNLLCMHTAAWVSLVGRDGKIIAESLPQSGISPDGSSTMDKELQTIKKPITAGGTNYGHISISRSAPPFTQDIQQMLDITICMYSLLLRQRERYAYNQRKQRQVSVRSAINALSYSELEAAIHIFQAITWPEGRLIAGHIADKLGFTRSVVVNALKKLEGAGVIETRSLGVKGTYIKIKDPMLVEELNKLKN